MTLSIGAGVADRQHVRRLQARGHSHLLHGRTRQSRRGPIHQLRQEHIRQSRRGPIRLQRGRTPRHPRLTLQHPSNPTRIHR